VAPGKSLSAAAIFSSPEDGALRIAAARQARRRERDAQAIRRLVDEDAIALDDRRIHRAARHVHPVRDGGAEHDHQDKERQQRFVGCKRMGNSLT